MRKTDEEEDLFVILEGSDEAKDTKDSRYSLEVVNEQ